MKDDKCGVYEIRNTVNNKVYIGSSKNIYDRWRQHIRLLENNSHNGKHFQNAWNLYGKDAFKFSILEECPPEERFKREQYYMDLTQCYYKKYGYNTNKKAYWQDCAAEVEAKISAASKKIIGEQRSKYTEAQAKKVIELLLDPKYTYPQIAEIAGVPRSFINNIFAHKNWKYLTENIEFPKRDRGNRKYQFNDEQINDIINRLLNGESNVEIAEIYDITYQEVHSIRTHKTYKKWTEGIEFPEVHKGGENCGATDLSDSQALEIIQLYNSGLSYNQIKEKTKIENHVISGIITGRHWKKFSHLITKEPPKAGKGELNSHAKLSEDDVISIIKAAKSGVSSAELATMYPVKKYAIDNIINGKSWKHINRDEIA